MNNENIQGRCNGCRIRESQTGSSSVFHCCPCDIYYIYPTNYKRHNDVVHGGKARSIPTAPYTCLDCNKDFYDEALFNGHLVGHTTARKNTEKTARWFAAQYKVSEPPKPQVKICKKCRKDFATQKLLENHRCTAAGLYNCLNLKCTKSFKQMNSLIMHLESGACGSGYDRQTINRIICENDTKGLITVPGAAKTLQDEVSRDAPGERVGESGIEEIFDDGISDTSSESSGILTPASTTSEESFVLLLRTSDGIDDIDISSGVESADSNPFLSAPQRSPLEMNPAASENRCHICERSFRKPKDLKQHFDSPVHASILYHCDLSFLGLQETGKRREFKTLSGLVQHVEVGACKGGKSTFELAKGMLDTLAREFGFQETNEYRKMLGGILPP